MSLIRTLLWAKGSSVLTRRYISCNNSLFCDTLSPIRSFYDKNLASMTSRGVLYSLRSIRFNRVLFNGRRRRFLDSAAFYSNNRCPESLHRKWTPTQTKAFNTDSATLSKFHCSNSVVEMDTEFSLEISSDGRPLANDRRQLIALATSLHVLQTIRTI